jgi:hypothetical protein
MSVGRILPITNHQSPAALSCSQMRVDESTKLIKTERACARACEREREREREREGLE